MRPFPLAPVAPLLALVALVACASTAPAPVHRSHFGVDLENLGKDQALPPEPEQGRTEEDRHKAERLLADGQRLREAGDLAGSQKALEEALSLDASLARAHVEWALTSEGLGVEPALIAAHYQLGARLAPDDPRAQTLAAAWAARQGDTDRALEGYDRALAADPRSLEALCRRADLLAQRGDGGAAMASYQQALAVDARFVPALVGLSDAAEKTGSLEVAERSLRALVDLYPEATVYRTKLIAFFRRTEQTAKANSAQRELDKMQPKDTRRLRKLRRR